MFCTRRISGIFLHNICLFYLHNLGYISNLWFICTFPETGAFENTHLIFESSQGIVIWEMRYSFHFSRYSFSHLLRKSRYQNISFFFVNRETKTKLFLAVTVKIDFNICMSFLWKQFCWLRYFNFEPSFKQWWCHARDLFGTQIPVTAGGFELRISCIQSRYLTH